MIRKAAGVCCVVCAFGWQTGEALAAKPTKAFKRGVEAVWGSDDVPAFAVTRRGDLEWGSMLGKTSEDVLRWEYCPAYQWTEGAVEVAPPDKYSAKRLTRPLALGRVLKPSSVFFYDWGVQLILVSAGESVVRQDTKTGQASTDPSEIFCILLNVRLTPGGGSALDAADVPRMLAAAEGVFKPFRVEADAERFAAEVREKTPAEQPKPAP